MCLAGDEIVDLSTGAVTTTADLTAEADDVDVPCLPMFGGAGGGGDRFIEFTVTAAGSVLQTDYTLMSMGSTLFALAMDSGGVCVWLECTDVFPTSSGTLESLPLAPGTYWLVLDAFAGWAEESVDVTLTLQ